MGRRITLSEALDGRLRLLAGVQSIASGGAPREAEMIRHVMASYLERGLNNGRNVDRWDPGIGGAALSSRAIIRAPLLFIASEVQDLLYASARSMPDAPLEANEIYGPFGFAILENPLTVNHIDLGVPVTVIGWTWAAMGDNDGKYVRLSDTPNQVVITTIFEASDCRGAWFPACHDAIDFGLPPIGQLNEILHAEDDFYRRVLPVTIWRLCQQRIACPTHGEIPRPVRRRHLKAGAEIPIVSVMMLRRYEEAAHNETGQPVNWSHRWIVNGHWRNQYFPSIDGHRLQWIAPHVKGPTDKPLVVKERVSVFKR